MNVLVLGISQSGKSTYGAQLLLRTEDTGADTVLRERQRPKNIRALRAAVNALLDGRPPTRTPQETHDRVVLLLRDAEGQDVDLVWPEFAGEAFKKQVLLSRVLPGSWAEDARTSGALLLLLRPDMDAEAPDVTATARQVTQRRPETDADVDPAVVVPQPDARYVELLQLILFVRGVSRRDRARYPLVVGLTFWDDLKTRYRTPEEALRDTYPLLAAFLRGAWREDSWRVYGLSPQGRALTPDDSGVDEAYAASGPVTNGVVALPDGTEHADLTLPIAWLAERSREA